MTKLYLRNLALTVGNSGGPGDPAFFWAILESVGDATDFPVEVATSEGTFDTYMGALRAGFDA